MAEELPSLALDVMQVEAVEALRALVILAGSVVAAQVLKRSVRRWLHRGDCEVGVADLTARFVGYALVLLGVVYALMALDVQVGPLLGALGVGGLAVALATKGLLEDLFGGIVLQARHPFHRGDEISVGDHEGIVEDINLRTVVLRTHDGTRLFLPSSMVLDEPIRNLTAYDARRTVVSLPLPFGTDVVPVAAAVAAAVAAVPAVHASPAVQAQADGVGEDGIGLRVRFWHDPGVAAAHTATDQATTAAIVALAALGLAPDVPQRGVQDGRSPVGGRGTTTAPRSLVR